MAIDNALDLPMQKALSYSTNRIRNVPYGTVLVLQSCKSLQDCKIAGLQERSLVPRELQLLENEVVVGGRVVEERPPLWERQSWDTTTSYESFLYDYLPQPKPRSYRLAYHAYCKRTGREPHRDAYGNTQVGKQYSRWVNGWNYAGLRPEGSPFEFSLTWNQRAEFYDQFVFDRVLQRQLDRAMLVPDIEWNMTMLAQDRLKKLLAMDVKDTRVSETDISRTMKVISDLARRAAALPDSVARTDWQGQISDLGIDPAAVKSALFQIISQLDQDANQGEDAGDEGISPDFQSDESSPQIIDGTFTRAPETDSAQQGTSRYARVR